MRLGGNGGLVDWWVGGMGGEIGGEMGERGDGLDEGVDTTDICEGVLKFDVI